MKEKIKILHIITGLQQGGAEHLLVEVVKHSDKNIFVHEVIYFYPGIHVSTLQREAIKIHHAKKLLCVYDLYFFLHIIWLVFSIKPNIIHSWLWSGNIIGRLVAFLFGIPHISSYHNNVDQNGFVRNMIDRYTLQLSSMAVPVGNNVAASLIKEQIFYPAHKITIIRNGINSDMLRKQAFKHLQQRQTYGFIQEHIIIGAVGRLVPLKNYPLLIESFIQISFLLPQLRLMIIGCGPEELKLRNLIKQYKLEDKILLVGAVPAFNYYPLFNCFVQPSYQEGISIALLEAMSFGLPCIVTGELTHEVIEHNINGLISKPEVKNLSEALYDFCKNQKKAQQLGKNAQVTVERLFNFSEMLREYQNLYIKLYPMVNL